MRRFILIFILAPLAVKAQDNNGQKVTANGYHYSFGGTSTSFSNIGWVPGCDGDNATKAITDDGSVAGEYSITVDGEQASWEHVELDFVDPTGLLVESVDLSEEVYQLIDVNLSATVDGEIMIVLGDGVTLHPDPAKGWELSADNVPALLFNYEVSMGRINVSNANDDFAGNDPGDGGFGWGVFQSDAYLQGIDMINIDSTAINQMWVYFRAGTGVEPSCTGPNSQIAGTLTLHNIGVGVLGLNEEVDEASFDVYPNPVEGTLKFSEYIEEVEIYTSNGELLDVYLNVESINMSSYEAGLYILQTPEGYKRISVR